VNQFRTIELKFSIERHGADAPVLVGYRAGAEMLEAPNLHFPLGTIPREQHRNTRI
jgi:hypothetical protein